MTIKQASTPTRIAADVATNAASIARTENRTAAEQINHWARVGMQIERSMTVDTRRLLAVVEGDAQFSTLTADERTVAHATIDARIAERVARERFGLVARKAGRVTVSIEDDGTLVEIAPDGSRRPL